MAVALNPYPEILDNSPTLPEQPPGSTLVASVWSQTLYQIRADEEVGTHQIDFVSLQLFGPDTIADLFSKVAPLILDQMGRELVGYVLWASPANSIIIPDTICVGQLCVEPPGAGTEIAAATQYRLWFMTRIISPNVSPYAVQARGFVMDALAVGLVAIILIAMVAGIQQMREGKVTWSQLSGFVKDISPGGQMAQSIAALAWPMLAFGFAIAITAKVLPEIAKSMQGRVGYGTKSGIEASAGIGRR